MHINERSVLALLLILLFIGRASLRKCGKFNSDLRAVDEAWWFYQVSQWEPDLALSAYISKVNAQYPNPLASSAASDWMQCESIEKLKKLYALNYVCKKP